MKRKPDRNIRFRLEGPSIGVGASWLVVALSNVRRSLGRDAVKNLIAEMRKRGDLECTDKQARELAQS